MVNGPIGSSSLATPNATPVDERLDQASENASQNTRKSSPKALDIPASSPMSPPDSKENSSDEDLVAREGRARELENLAELQAAIRTIEQHRESSPERMDAEARKSKEALGILVQEPTAQPSTSVNMSSKSSVARPPLSAEARKISHSRSATESAAYLDLSRPSDRTGTQSLTDSDDDDEEEMTMQQKPPMVRKKSGELVRPALRPYSKRRPSSMPGTPTYSKAVHFDSHLEHVRTFMQVDQPLAVSAGSSPVETLESDIEFPFSPHSRATHHSMSGSSSFQWELRLPNMPRDSIERASMPVRVDKVFLSADTKTLIGAVSVRNLAFQKFVATRFTLDYWKTTSEVVAEFNNDLRRRDSDDGRDRFNFNIKLEDQANLENKTMFFCVRYNVNGQEYWDSNGGGNYQVDFVKKPVPRRSHHSSTSSLSDLPRSRPSPPTSSVKPRPKTTAFGEFSRNYEYVSSPESGGDGFPDAPIKLKSQRKQETSGSENNPATSSSSQIFATRYDFGASWTAAIEAAGSSVKDASGSQFQDASTQQSRRGPKRASFTLGSPGESPDSSAVESGAKPFNSIVTARRGSAPMTSMDSFKPNGLASDKPTIQSQSYNELLDKYCFVRSKGSRDIPESNR